MRQIVFAAMLLLAAPPIALGQNFPMIDSQTGAPAATPKPIVRPKKPVQQAPAASTVEQNAPSARQPNSAPTVTSGEKKSAKQDPAATAAQRQSGLTEVQARSAPQQQGYASVSTLEAQPNSVWVWQADAMKNGRRVRLGIDHRGNVLELGAARPCALPGMSSGVGGLGVGARLSEATGCSGR